MTDYPPLKAQLMVSVGNTMYALVICASWHFYCKNPVNENAQDYIAHDKT